MKSRLVLLSAAIALLMPPAAMAQSNDSWWKLFEIRKAFDGDSGEQEPGSLGLVDPGPDSRTAQPAR